MAAENPSSRKKPGNVFGQVVVALELPLVMAGSVVIGGGIGYLLDRYLSTVPMLTVVGGILGFVAGTWDIIRRLTQDERRQGKRNGKNSG
ncbi:MAG TPA: AtpZ/AtpI family protein [Candidatus Acidoferrum sp.]|nr:AtpZ/AtpI family protein [Candidatus Acidoferrum sp.]